MRKDYARIFFKKKKSKNAAKIPSLGYHHHFTKPHADISIFILYPKQSNTNIQS